MQTAITALAEPNRMRIVELLRGGPRSVNEIAQLLWLKQPHVSKHLRVLSKAGLVRSRPNAQQRFYELQARPFQELNVWLDTFAEVWCDRMDNFDAYLQSRQNKDNSHDGDK